MLAVASSSSRRPCRCEMGEDKGERQRGRDVDDDGVGEDASSPLREGRGGASLSPFQKVGEEGEDGGCQWARRVVRTHAHRDTDVDMMQFNFHAFLRRGWLTVPPRFTGHNRWSMNCAISLGLASTWLIKLSPLHFLDSHTGIFLLTRSHQDGQLLGPSLSVYSAISIKPPTGSALPFVSCFSYNLAREIRFTPDTQDRPTCSCSDSSRHRDRSRC